jgi:aspartyl-tRNA synthetase
VEVLSGAEPPPFPVSDRIDADEIVRLRYRYVDLRRPRLQRNLRMRAAVNRALRASMDAQGFVEVETPMLIPSTPEGARDFIVPSRLHPGAFYALPQSPQVFKQLLMVGGLDRYYQIARCLRDEDLRADRQFEFMQLDMEMSFAEQDDVIEAISHAMLAATEAATGTSLRNVPRMTWHEAQERYGTDKPDVRFGMELVDVTELFASTEFNAFKGKVVKGISAADRAELGRAALDRLTDRAKQLGASGLVWLKVGDDGSLTGPVAKFVVETEQKALVAALGAVPGDLLLLVADADRMVVNRALGGLRLDLGRPPVNEGGFHFQWVTEFPLFEAIDADGRPVPAHHPFTMPHVDDLELLEGSGRALLDVRSQSYDLVLNGWELGSGSVRIHRSDIQQRIFSLLGIEPDAAQVRFGFLLDGFRYGAPPHAGFAVGIDRFAAILAGEENIREVIAFPKTQSGADPLTNAPAPVAEAQLRELGLHLLPPRLD